MPNTTVPKSTKRQLRGTFHELRGAARQKLGEVTNNPVLTMKGRAEKFGGRVQKKAGQIEKVFGR
jgi:uncharacterized protein YjbJ (UPF0337 family)